MKTGRRGVGIKSLKIFGCAVLFAGAVGFVWYMVTTYAHTDKNKAVHGAGSSISSNLDHDGNEYNSDGSVNKDDNTSKAPEEEQEEDVNRGPRPNPGTPMNKNVRSFDNQNFHNQKVNTKAMGRSNMTFGR